MTARSADDLAGSVPPVDNPPGLGALKYRVCDYSGFKTRMFQSLARDVRIRSVANTDADDPTSALVDAWAVVLDVISFYQERIANEGFLRTATERHSIRELGRSVGYELNPGVSAETFLAFTLDDVRPGQPKVTVIDSGTKVQSIPGPGEEPQIFETAEKIEARSDWNSIRPLLVEEPRVFPRHLYLAGSVTRLQPGDAILIVGDEREQYPDKHPQKERWDVRILLGVVPDTEKNWTLVTWEEPLGKAQIKPAEKNVRVFAFRQRARMFGHNAVNPNLMTVPSQDISNHLFTTGAGTGLRSWQGYSSQSGIIDLDAAYPKILNGSWIALKRPPERANERGYVELYRVKNISFPSRAQYGISSDITRIVPDTNEHLTDYKLDETLVYAQTEELTIAAPPRVTRTETDPSRSIELEPDTLVPVEGTAIAVEVPSAELPDGRLISITGKRMRARICSEVVLTGDDVKRTLRCGETVLVMSAPQVDPSDAVAWRLQCEDGFEGTAQTGIHDLRLSPAMKADPEVSELAVIRGSERASTEMQLLRALQNIFDRTTVRITANVVRATHGETRRDVLGSGDASRSFQLFELHQGPLTFTPASTPTGSLSSLKVIVNGIHWDYAPSLYGLKPRDPSYTWRQKEGGKSVIQFGDGITGARLPTGNENVTATYRIGLGQAGNVKANQLQILLSRPLTVRSVTNPQNAGGGIDPEDLEDARRNVPYRSLTIDRIVTLRDYEDFARSFPGVAKARADWLWDGWSGTILVTVTGQKGRRLDESVYQNLCAAINRNRDQAQRVRIENSEAKYFRIRARIILDPRFQADDVLTKADAMLRHALSIARREFGQDVTEGEILGLLQSVDGVTAADMTTPYPGPEWKSTRRLSASLPRSGGGLAGMWILEESRDAITLKVVSDLNEPE